MKTKPVMENITIKLRC